MELIKVTNRDVQRAVAVMAALRGLWVDVRIGCQHVPRRTHDILSLTHYPQWSIHFLKPT